MVKSPSTPAVSIIMNCYNGDKFLKEAINSIYAQTFQDWEIIFWDNASTDLSAVIAKSYDDRLKYFCSIKTVPLGEVRNYALKKATGKYIAFLDCDDLYIANKLEKQVLLMERGMYVLSYGSAIIINEQGEEVRRCRMKNKSGYVFDKLLRKYEINMQSVMILRQFLQKKGLEFKLSLQYSPDYNLFMRIASQASIGVLHSFLIKYRVSQNSLSKKMLHRTASEAKYTIDSIYSKNDFLKKKYSSAFQAAYNKINYYKSIDMINKKLFREARQELLPIIWYSPKYFLLYLLTYSGLSKNTILHLLRR